MNKNILRAAVIACFALLSFNIQKDTTYKVDAQKSSLVWTGKKVTGEHTGTIPLHSGSILSDLKNIKGGTFEFNVAGLTVTDITDQDVNTKLVNHLKNDDFFSTDKYPLAKFVILSAEQKDGDNYVINGNLTIKGITHPISFPAVVKIDSKTLTATGKITVNRAKYDIRFRSSSFFENLGDKAIYDDFTLDINLISRI